MTNWKVNWNWTKNSNGRLANSTNCHPSCRRKPQNSTTKNWSSSRTTNCSTTSWNWTQHSNWMNRKSTNSWTQGRLRFRHCR